MEPRVDVVVSNNWEKISIPGNSRYMTFYTEDKSLIDIYVTNNPEPNLSSLNKDDYITIGGINYFCDVYTGLNIFVRSKNEESRFYYLPKGQLDPEKNIDTIYEFVLNFYDDFRNHIDNNNPHGINKINVGLSNIPNRISDIIPSVAPNQIDLATNMSIYILNKTLTDKINSITREYLDIDQVSNYPMASAEDILNKTITDKYVSIKDIYDIIYLQEQTLNEIEPNLIYNSQLSDLLPEHYNVYDPMTMTITLTTANVIIREGLQVTYKDKNRTYISEPLSNDVTIPKTEISSTISPYPGYHYVYVDINEYNQIDHIGTTTSRPIFGIYPTGTKDFFNTTKKIMYDENGEIIKRVYVGKLYVDTDGEIIYAVNVPVGKQYVYRCPSVIIPAKTYFYENPYMGNIDVKPEILVNGEWRDPRWNDQIGVISNYNLDMPNKIVVQTGKYGLTATALNAGNAFSATAVNISYPDSANLRLIIRSLI
jgi:hypothetical protein